MRHPAVPASLLPFWEQFLRSCPGYDAGRFYDACKFGDSEELVNHLASLVVRGTKRATAGSVWSYQDAGIRVPRPSDLSIVVNWGDQPQCIIETRSVELVVFKDVTAEFAAIEGEGDGSLAFWRRAHLSYFQRECARNGQQFSENMVLACETFDVVYRGQDSAA